MLKRLLLPLTFLLLNPVLALELRPSGTIENLTLESNTLIRYTLDPVSGSLIIPDALFAAGVSFPAGLQWQKRGTGVVLLLPEGRTVSLSPDGKRLFVRSENPLEAPTPDVELPSSSGSGFPGATPGALGGPAAPVASTVKPLFLPLSNADARTSAALLSRLMGPSVRVEVDDRNRSLIVLAPEDQQDTVRALVAAIDGERPQVMFEAEILEINQDTTQALGINYTDLLTFTLSEAAPKNLFSLGKITRKPLGDKALSIGINFLKTSGSARVLAQPRVTTLDGVEARINSTQTTPILTTSKEGTQSIVNLTTGIQLRLTPKVAPDGTVEATLNVSVSNPTGSASGGAAPFSTRDASTTVRVKNGEPIAIGGLLETRTTYGEEKVPFLGDLPFIGALFTNTTTETHHTDLVILVTPRLVFPEKK